MNTTELQTLAPQDRAFIEVAGAALRASEGLNYVEAARLSATRAQVRELMLRPRRSIPAWGWVAAPAAVAALLVSLHRFDLLPATSPSQPPTELLATLSVVNAPQADALVWTTDEAGPDFYRDLEFYEWLQSRSSTEPNA